MQRGDLDTLEDIAGRSMYVFHSSGRVGENRMDDIFTYDVNLLEAQSPWGRSVAFLTLPRGIAFKTVTATGGQVCSVPTRVAPWWVRFGLIPLRVTHGADGYIRVDVEDHPDEYQKLIIGGGEIAEVKTVLDTLQP